MERKREKSLIQTMLYGGEIKNEKGILITFSLVKIDMHWGKKIRKKKVLEIKVYMVFCESEKSLGGSFPKECTTN